MESLRNSLTSYGLYPNYGCQKTHIDSQTISKFSWLDTQKKIRSKLMLPSPWKNPADFVDKNPPVFSQEVLGDPTPWKWRRPQTSCSPGSWCSQHMELSKSRGFPKMVFWMEIPTKMNDLGLPLIWETTDSVWFWKRKVNGNLRFFNRFEGINVVVLGSKLVFHEPSRHAKKFRSCPLPCGKRDAKLELPPIYNKFCTDIYIYII